MNVPTFIREETERERQTVSLNAMLLLYEDTAECEKKLDDIRSNFRNYNCRGKPLNEWSLVCCGQCKIDFKVTFQYVNNRGLEETCKKRPSNVRHSLKEIDDCVKKDPDLYLSKQIADCAKRNPHLICKGSIDFLSGVHVSIHDCMRCNKKSQAKEDLEKAKQNLSDLQMISTFGSKYFKTLSVSTYNVNVNNGQQYYLKLNLRGYINWIFAKNVFENPFPRQILYLCYVPSGHDDTFVRCTDVEFTRCQHVCEINCYSIEQKNYKIEVWQKGYNVEHSGTIRQCHCSTPPEKKIRLE